MGKVFCDIILPLELTESNEPGIDPRLFSEEILKVPEFIPTEPVFVLFLKRYNLH